MKILRHLTLAICLTASVSMPAMADVVDRPYFKASAIVIVIVIGATEDEANSGVAPVAVDLTF